MRERRRVEVLRDPLASQGLFLIANLVAATDVPAASEAA
jgi:hypothetical protein